MKVLKKIVVDLYTLEYNENGILYVHVSDKGKETIEGQKKAVEALGELVNYKQVPMFVKFDTNALPEAEIRANWAKEESNPYSLAEAFLIDSLALKLIGNFYLRVNKPARPSKMFTDEKEAIAWLKTFLKD